MSEQLKQEFEVDIDRLEAGTTIDGEIIGNQEKETAEGKIEDQEGNETNEEDVVQMGKASLADIVSRMPAPTEAEIKAAEAENAKPVKKKAREKLEAEKKKALLDVREQVIALSTEIASRVLQAKLTSEEDQALVARKTDEALQSR